MKEAGKVSQKNPRALGELAHCHCSYLCPSGHPAASSQQTDSRKAIHICLWIDSGSWATGSALSSVFLLGIAKSSRPPLDSEWGKCAHEP